MIGLIFGLLTGPTFGDKVVDGEDALAIARQYLRDIGIHEKLQLSQLMPVKAKPSGPGGGTYYEVTFRFPDKRTASVWISQNGLIQEYEEKESEPIPGYGDTIMLTQKTSAKALELFKAAHPALETVQRTTGGFQSGKWTSAEFDVSIAGHRFLNQTDEFAYNIFYNLESGELRSFRTPASLPPVVATEAKIPPYIAVKSLEQWGRAHTSDGGNASSVFKSDSGSTPWIVPELGFYKFKNENKARLVWQAHVWTTTSTGANSDVGILKVFADATTGELVVRDDGLVR